MKVKIEGMNVCKKYYTEKKASIDVIRDINFKIYENDFVSFVGPSGCGKTTLLRMIAGLEHITSGKILIDGKEINRPGRDRGMIFQQDAILPWRTVIKNVEYGLELHNVNLKERENIAYKYLEMVNLKEFSNFYPKELSGGMKKRVAIAMVFANSPDVILCDEPFGSLDYPTKINLQKELLKIREKEKITQIFVTHDLEEALFLSNRIIVLYQRKIVEEIRVDFPYPRTDELRNNSEFLNLKAKLWRYFQ